MIGDVGVARWLRPSRRMRSAPPTLMAVTRQGLSAPSRTTEQNRKALGATNDRGTWPWRRGVGAWRRACYWRNSMSEGCVFCDQSWMRAAEIFIETPHCIFASTRDPDIRAQAGLAEGVLPGSGQSCPSPHRTSVFELTPAEWADTRVLLLQHRWRCTICWHQTAICWAGTRASQVPTSWLAAGCQKRDIKRTGPRDTRRGHVVAGVCRPASASARSG
jgi:hypothetical protein